MQSSTIGAICNPPCSMAIRFDDIGNRLRAFRLGSGLSADEIARRLDISRAALYRFEKGELAKIETLGRLSELLGVSVPTLLGVGVEYIASAVAYFERLRQTEETAEQIIVLAGPISYLLASESFDATLAQVLTESIPADLPAHDRAIAEVGEIMAILQARKAQYQRRQPAVVNLISASEIERFLHNGLVGRLDLDETVRAERRAQAVREVTKKHGIVMIFDEIVTGFRIAWGGAQERYGVVPDLACYGKAVSGGFPMAAIAGSGPSRWLALLPPQTPDKDLEQALADAATLDLLGGVPAAALAPLLQTLGQALGLANAARVGA